MARRTKTHDRVRRPRRKSKAGRWFRILLMLACFALVGFIAKAMIVKAVRPWWIDHNEKKESVQLQQQIDKAKAENRAIKRDIAYLDTPEGKIAEARRLGWVKQGEVAVVVPNEGPSPFDGEPIPEPSFWDNLVRRVAGVFVKGR